MRTWQAADWGPDRAQLLMPTPATTVVSVRVRTCTLVTRTAPKVGEWVGSHHNNLPKVGTRQHWWPLSRRSEQTPICRLCWSWIARAGIPVCGCGCPHMSQHIHLVFLPAYSPELQPAGHVWSLTNTLLVNTHFASIEDLEEAHVARCVALQTRPDLMRSATLFHWWSKRIRTRRGSRRSYRMSMVSAETGASAAARGETTDHSAALSRCIWGSEGVKKSGKRSRRR